MVSPLFGDVAAEKIAYRMTGSGEAVTYGQLEARSNQAAQLFRTLGLRPGDHIAFYLENNARFLEIVWGAQRSGLIYSPISSRLTAGEAAYIVNDSGAKAFIASAQLPATDELPALLSHAPTLLRLGGSDARYGSWEDRAAAQPPTRIADEVAGSSMIYSSGTTGRPKGVRTTLRDEPINALNPVLLHLQKLVGFGRDTVYLSPAPLYHAAPLRWNMLVQALGGTCLIMERFDEREYLRHIDAERVTHSQVVPTMFVRLLKLPEAERRQYDVSSLQCVIHAAAPCPVQVKQQMIEWWGPILFEFYSATEGAGTTTITSAEWLTHPGSVGRPADNPIHILDDRGRECASGEVGVIYFEGRREFSYHNDDAKLAECLNDKGWITTGDIGYLDAEGYLYLTDRKAFMIISGGVNIYPQEIEDALINHPKVMDAAVFGIPNEEFGEEVKAVVQPVDFARADAALAEELSAYCRSHLSALKCPKSIDFTVQLPRHPNGKLYKRLLREPYWRDKGVSRII
jgi:acyl-CoA synthetase (AMP-forming)/AMP-acid ligase II